MLRQTLSPLLGLAIAALAPVAARAADAERGVIRLTSPLVYQLQHLATDPKGRFVAASSADGTVTAFDLEDASARPYPEVFYSPYREEEPEKARAVAVSPDGNVIALSAVRALDGATVTPDSARIYFYRRANKTRVFYAIEGLPTRPTSLRFASWDNGARFLLAATFADKRRPRVWDVTD